MKTVYAVKTATIVPVVRGSVNSHNLGRGLTAFLLTQYVCRNPESSVVPKDAQALKDDGQLREAQAEVVVPDRYEEP